MIFDREAMSNISLNNTYDIIELQAELPEALNVDILLGTVNLWRDLRDYFNKPIRIYTTCHNTVVEKYIEKVISGYQNLYLTIIPARHRDLLDQICETIK